MDTRKIINALAVIVSMQTGKSVDNIKAYKLLWLADRLHLRRFGRTITGDTYFAMPKGPVPSDAKNILEGQQTKLKNVFNVKAMFSLGTGCYSLVGEPNMTVFSKTDIDCLNDVIACYNGLSAEDLVELSHKFPEWKAYENKLKDKDELNSHKMDMCLMFENYDDGKGLFREPNERLALTKQVFEVHYGYRY